MQAKRGSSLQLEKVPPQNLEAERAVLGAMLLEKETIPKVLQIITNSKSFYSEVHTLIYEGIASLFNENKPVDILALKEEFRKKGKLKEVGGASYLADLVNSVPTTVNVAYYAQIVKEKHILRDLLKTADFIRSLSYDDSQDLDILLDKAQSSIFDITQQRVQTPYRHIKDVLTETFEHIEALYERKEHITGIPTGFAQLDRLTSGFQPSDLVVIAGRPSIGKTSFALNIAEYAGIEAKIPLVIFSLESAKEQLVERLLCSEARVDSHKLRTGFLSEDDWSRLTDAAGTLAEAPIYIDDSANIGVLEIRAKARQLKAEHDIKMAIIDYLQLMEGDRRAENRQQQISEISRSLKALAKELNITVVAISQLSRAVEQREDKRPRLSDLRESGAIEQDADLVLSLYREYYYSRSSDDEGKAEIIINKQRRGPTDKLDLIFISEYTRFENPELGEI
ncbi:replicative DNA helicase [Candidatus Aerophobetes bacterium]|uniref:Replicative DNA helicase n=1 Tax=Aerophobetes bacterium TaxID=2030807 RepID=A0A523THR0_UNCAE|nr:MAG: replicative DNA helicase [Candidatus Aerophobetes bacterium]